MGKKKVVLIGPAYPYRGGIAAFNERMAREFLSMGYEVDVFTFTLQYPGFLFPGKTQYAEGPAPSDLNIVRCINSTNPLNWRKVARRIRKEQLDVVFFFFF